MNFSRFISPSYYYQRYLFGIALLIIALPFSKFLMSVSQFYLLGNWLLLYRNPIKSFKIFLKNKPAVILTVIYLIHLFGMLYSSDFKYGLEDLRKKIPLLILPIIIASSPLIQKQHIYNLLKLFVITVFASSLVSIAIYIGISGKEIIDIRSISIFISHIRFALMICFSAFISAYFFIKEKNKLRYIYLFFLFWMIAMLFILESITGIAILIITSIILLSYYVIKSKQPILKALYFITVIICLISISAYFYTVYKKVSHFERIDFSKLDKKSASGEIYYHNTESTEHENGNLIWIYIANEELKNTWNEISSIPIDSLDLKGNHIRYTLIRFLASKGLRKDREAILSLSKEEIKAIEKGIANVEYIRNSKIKNRIHQTIWEIYKYQKGHNPNGHSLAMRLEFWKAALGIITENLLLGVGTGDVNQAFLEQYQKSNSPLDPQNRLRAHNQYLEITVALGIIGFLIFIFCIFYPIWLNRNYVDYFYYIFLIIALSSMLTEDTLETQAGVTYFALFNSLLLLQGEKNHS
jgi:hypothetical protein